LIEADHSNGNFLVAISTRQSGTKRMPIDDRSTLPPDTDPMVEPMEAVLRQMAFDDHLESIRREGAEAFRAGLSREDCPYLDHPEPHFRATWIGGMAEAALGLDEGGGPTP
jgi:ribosome modulation factor